MHPIFISLGPVTIRWYGVFIALGFLAAHWLFQKHGRRIELDSATRSNLILLIFLSGILGARVYYVLLHWQEYKTESIEIFRIDHGGLVFFGGFLAACITLWVWAHWKKQAVAPLLDALAAPLALGHALGRMGCFMNGCCHGKPCDYFWAVRLNSPPEIAGTSVHPVQLYEFFGLLDICLALLFLEKLRRYPGYVFLSYVVLYAVLRFTVEFFRGDVPRVLMERFTLAQGISAGLLLIAWIAMARLTGQFIRSRKQAALRHARNHPSQCDSVPKP